MSNSQNIPNYLVWSILSTLFCCLPLGVVSIIFASKVDSLANAGDIAGAQKASDDAKKWAIFSAGAGIIAIVLYAVMGGMAAMSHHG